MTASREQVDDRERHALRRVTQLRFDDYWQARNTLIEVAVVTALLWLFVLPSFHFPVEIAREAGTAAVVVGYFFLRMWHKRDLYRRAAFAEWFFDHSDAAIHCGTLPGHVLSRAEMIAAERAFADAAGDPKKL